MRAPVRRSSQPSIGLHILPVASLWITTLLSLITLPIPFLATNPYFVLITLYYFVMWQPRYLPVMWCFLAGLFFDMFQSGLIGTHALLLTLLYTVLHAVRSRHNFVQHTGLAWLYFAITAIVYFAVEWCVLSVQAGYAITDNRLLLRNGATIMCYPLLHMLYSRLIAKLQEG